MTKLMSIYEDASENLVLCKACAKRYCLPRIDVASEGDKCDRCGTIDDDLPTNRVRIPTSKRENH